MAESEDFDSLCEKNDTSTYISEDDQAHLLSVTCRLRRLLNWDVNTEEQVHDKTRGPSIIRDLLNHFRRWKASVAVRHNETEATGFHHLIAYSLAKLCFFYWIRDSLLVEEVLRLVYSCDGHFSPFFAYIVGRDDRINVFWRTTQGNDRERDHLALLFFLHHSHKSNLQFSGVRFVDLSLRQPLRVPPVILASVYSKPQPLLLLLRYGANLSRGSLFRGNAYTRTNFADDWDVPLLLRHLMRILWTSLGNELRTDEVALDVVITNSTNNVIQCLNIMLRVITQVDMGELDFTLTSFDHGLLTGTCCSRDFIRWISKKMVVPKLASRYLEPAELKHLSRCIIRTALNMKWNLPSGISELPLPRLLKDYIDIADD